jgi:tetratricopeptide (TPR) repeat protein
LKALYHLTTLGLTTVLVAIPHHLVSALPAPKISQIAKKITVKITSIDSEGNAAYGSGVIIKRKGNTYTLLSTSHVFSKSLRNHKVKTSDNQEYAINSQKIRTFAKNIDLAVVEFDSAASYPTVELGSSNTIIEGSNIFVAGFPAPTQTIESPAYMFRKGDVVANSASGLNRDGYGMIYTANTLPGMSGGGVFDENGKLVAIHGQGDIDSKFVGDNSNPNVRFKTGNDLGIPIDTYFANAASVAIDTGRSAPPAPAAPPRASDFYVAATNKKEKEDYPGAIADYTKAIQLDSKFAKAYNERGLVYKILKQEKNALADFDRAIQLKPDLAEAYSNRAISYLDSNPQKGLFDIQKLVELKPTDSMSYYLLSIYYVKLENTEGAIAALNQGIKFVSEDEKITMTFFKMMYRFALNDLDGMAHDAREINSRWRDAPLAYKGIGVYLLIVSGQNAEADKVLNKLIVQNPKNAIPQWLKGVSVLLGKAINSEANFAQSATIALPYFEKAILAEPRSHIGYSARQIVRQAAKNYQGALADANTAVKLNPKNPILYNNRGVANLELGKFQLAIVDFNKAINLQKPILAESKNDSDEIERDNTFHYYRGVGYEEVGDFRNALADHNYVLKNNNVKDGFNSLSMGMAHKTNKKTKKIQTFIYNRTGVRGIKYNSAFASRGRVKLLLGDNLGGFADIEQAIKVHDGPAAYYQRALIRRDTGDKAGAISDLKLALEKASKSKIAENTEAIKAELQKLGVY